MHTKCQKEKKPEGHSRQTHLTSQIGGSMAKTLLDFLPETMDFLLVWHYDMREVDQMPVYMGPERHKECSKS